MEKKLFDINQDTNGYYIVTNYTDEFGTVIWCKNYVTADDLKEMHSKIEFVINKSNPLTFKPKSCHRPNVYCKFNQNGACSTFKCPYDK